MTYRATDEFGWHAVQNGMRSKTACGPKRHAVQNNVHVHDLHATILHLMGIDHERLTLRHAGRDYRLTDVHGRIVKDVIA